MRELIQLDIIKQILTEYGDDVPVHFFLKDFYKKHRQFGSRDRKFYSDCIYKYFRCKTLFTKLSIEEKLCYSGFLTTQEPSAFHEYLYHISHLSPELNKKWNQDKEVKINFLIEEGIISLANYFPASHSIAEKVNIDRFFKSHLVQPNFFIRVSSQYLHEAIAKLRSEQIEFETFGQCIAFDNQTDISKHLPEEYFEIQDRSSQNTIGLFNISGNEKAWDCCSGAGGKSLMLMDKFPELQLYCSDNRESILQNLNSRFQEKKNKPSVAKFDIVKNRGGLKFGEQNIPDGFFDIIIADVPCSGSGTWGRNPERLYQFKEEEITSYTKIQQSIIENAVRYLRPGGQLVYITCSVYKNENSDNALFFKKFGLELKKEEYFIGYENYADTLYGAVLEKK